MTQLSNRLAVTLSGAALLMSIGFAGGPVIARAIVPNADKVDGLHAVKAKASTDQRKGKLVATDPKTGAFKDNVIPDSAKVPATAPVGITLSGAWSLDTQSAGAGGDYGTQIDFGMALPSAPQVIFVMPGVPTAHCSGDFDVPQADAGYACLYWGAGAGLDTGGFHSFVLANRGIGFRWDSVAVGANEDIFANGSWAVTTAAVAPKGTKPGRNTK